MARLVDSEVTKLVWLAGDATVIADIKAPTVTELTAAVDITCYVLKNYEVRADASDTTDESAVCDSAAGAVPTRKKYTGNLPLFRDFASTGLPDTTDLLAVFHEDYPQGYFIRRVGKPQETAFAATDVLDIYHFSGDVPQIQGGTGEGFLKMTVPLLPTGKFTTKAVVAGP
ncbi:phage tail tube protein [Nakamurella lactea]|uniref:phage tail tube protein n=1 Tax=Nakamurella lactea TaxID=459515 RepID=UPI000421E043|nr:hypothetical protein [Nakamurella lactea]